MISVQGRRKIQRGDILYLYLYLFLTLYLYLNLYLFLYLYLCLNLSLSLDDISTRKAEDTERWHFIRLHRRCYNSISPDHPSLSSHYFCCICTSFNSYLYSQLLYFSDICICVFARVCICANFVLYLYWSPPHCPLSSAALWSPAPFWSARHQKRDMLIRDLKQIQNQLPGGDQMIRI